MTYGAVKAKILSLAERVQMTQFESLDELERGSPQKAAESVEALAQRIQDLVSKAYPTTRGKEKELMEKRYFIKNLANKTIATNLVMNCDDEMPFLEMITRATKATLHERTMKKDETPPKEANTNSRPAQSNNRAGSGSFIPRQNTFNNQRSNYGPGRGGNSGNGGQFNRNEEPVPRFGGG